MKTRSLLILLCSLLGGLLTTVLAQQISSSSRPPITGIMGFQLGMTKAEAILVAQEKGWTLEGDEGETLRIDFIKTKHFSGLSFSSLSLTFAPSGLARIFIGSPREYYDKEKTLMGYSNAQFLENLEEKYGLPDKVWYGYSGQFDDNSRGYRHLTLLPIPGQELEYKSALELTWQSKGRRIWVGYFKNSPNAYTDKVFVGVFYEDDALWSQHHQIQSKDY